MGIEYEHVAVNFMDESKKPEYLAVNPNGRIPALQDGDVTLFESMAIISTWPKPTAVISIPVILPTKPWFGNGVYGS